MKSIIYVGIDVHKATFSACSYVSKCQQFCAEETFEGNTSKVMEYLQVLRDSSENEIEFSSKPPGFPVPGNHVYLIYRLVMVYRRLAIIVPLEVLQCFRNRLSIFFGSVSDKYISPLILLYKFKHEIRSTHYSKSIFIFSFIYWFINNNYLLNLII